MSPFPPRAPMRAPDLPGRPTQRLVRPVVLTLLCGVALLLGSGQALAHTRLTSSDPADGASVATSPPRVSLTFNEPMQAEFSALTVTGPDGGGWQTGPAAVDGGTVSIALRPLGPAGRYEIGYRVVSDDGHPVTGTIGFVLTAPGPGTPAAPVPAQAAGAPTAPGAPVWPWIAGAIVLVVGGVVTALRLGRS